ncbi:hypothetical protein EIN_525860 [Entamoeba invadens IP1]|uniref:Uncharacterized protein n=1 Tax=Entamoeba invadens IP1 TaxID=370355 RepID=A0A0A1U8Y3_ENTIV|nr:hypothetical protein EIN_525860 [Entamoeba invadens IP1]ELP89591.1 hypothetical protein EIN_525860 [Entamoeba invadens IP1]|eukprot:XP_004256362.1 hypothetical protein EIN_525860 [Entamoeba invadens IP1]
MGCAPSFFGMYVVVLILWMVWIPLHFTSSIPFDIVPITLLAIFTIAFVALIVLGVVRRRNDLPMFPTPIFMDRKPFLMRSFTTVVFIQYVLGEAVLTFLPPSNMALFMYRVLHLVCPLLLGSFVFFIIKRKTTLLYITTAVLLPLTASYYSLWNAFGVQYYFFYGFYILFSIILCLLGWMIYPSIPSDVITEIQLD